MQSPHGSKTFRPPHDMQRVQRNEADWSKIQLNFLAQPLELFEFVVWAGLPSDFARVAKSSVLSS